MKNYFKKVAMAMLLLAMANVCAARQWHVNNHPNTTADFSSITAATESADVLAGDTICIGAGCVLTGTQSVKKAIILIGLGWEYDDSFELRSYVSGDLSISAAGAKVVGLRVSDEIILSASNITVERCWSNSIRHSNYSTHYNNAKIISCRTAKVQGYTSGNSYYNTGWTIKNCIIEGDANSMYKIQRATIENNVFVRSGAGTVFQNVIESVVKNNIIIQQTAGGETSIITGCGSSVFTNNIMSLPAEYEELYPHNIMIGSNDIATVFKCTGTVASGEYYSLRDGSPAIGAGDVGIDCGVTGGVYKFVPYGRPDHIPVIKSFTMPDTPTDGKINVTIGF